MWMKFGFQRSVTYSWAAFGPVQVVWNRPDGGPLVWLTTRTPRLLFGRFFCDV